MVVLLAEGSLRRTISVAAWVRARVDAWTSAAGVIEGSVFRAINKSGRVYWCRPDANGIWCIVQPYPAEIGVPKLALQRSARNLPETMPSSGWGFGADSASLLGARLDRYTERNLGSRLDLQHAVSDDLKIGNGLGPAAGPLDRAACLGRPPQRR